MNTPAEKDFDAGVAYAARRARIELELVESLLQNRRRGMAWAEAVGVTADHFDHEDLRAIFIAIEHTRWRDIGYTLQACKFLLKHVNRWDDRTPAGNRGAWWSSARLGDAAATWGRGCPALIPLLLSELKSYAPAPSLREAA